MLDLNELWDWLTYVKESYAFLIALPSFVALFLACIADWAERHLAHQEAPSLERTMTSAPNSRLLQEQWRIAPRELSGRS
jgi:hypothetical protein